MRAKKNKIYAKTTEKKKKTRDMLDAYKKVRKAWTRNPRTRVKESAKIYKRKGRKKADLFLF